ncbi:unnamed protein product [Vitrella brassicaformis CCMP3155]|uniref:Uncharacterized protein n=1 Tax=Vitrella brassicaformis (strain CCMP3155) TaxID=1169540 RepID=A0A0G4ERB8_VITBC|nr:unnamed protein product [Vitrella brassicaformis CCMP3155]|eukprot:CEM00569.1 unnamed protein product [Vitrella brassicaformis CCMP3155]
MSAAAEDAERDVEPHLTVRVAGPTTRVLLGVMAQSLSAASQAPYTQAVPPYCKGLDDVDTIPDEGVSALSQRLLEGCIRCNFTHASHQVTGLVRQGADPRAIGGLRVRGITLPPSWRYGCLSFAIDSPTNGPSLYAKSDANFSVPVVLPQWSSRQLQRDVINTLIDDGADVNAGQGYTRPIQVAVAAGNLTAVETLLARQANVRGFAVMRLPQPHVTRQGEKQLLSVYHRLIQHDSTLPEERFGGENLVHWAAMARSAFSQQFIDQYLDLITSHGAEMTATRYGRTPLHMAARCGSPYVADWLCRQLTAEDINRGSPNQPNETPLSVAAQVLDNLMQEQQQQHGHGNGLGEDQGEEERRQRSIRHHKTITRTLLRAGAAPSISRIPTATGEQRRRRQLVLTEYTTVLSELPDVTMSAINAALAPQRDHSMLLARLLPLAPHHDGAHPHPSPSNMAFGPHEAEAIGWKIGAFLHDPSAAVAAIDEYLIGDSQLRRRVRSAVGHFVKSAATQTSSNREVVGRMASVGGVMVRVPLQCFVVGDVGGQTMELREVIHKARKDEAAQYRVVGVVKGFNEHLGDQDCQFEWGQLGCLSRTGLFVSLGIE